MDKELLLAAPKVKRTHCYVQKPDVYDICCPICSSTNITWSEFEKHIWCYECEKDILLSIYHAGIFSGPIPVGVCEILGVVFDRINIVTEEIIKLESDNSEAFNNTWVRDESLSRYEAKINDILSKGLTRLTL